MTFIVEIGSGLPDATAYCTVAFVTSYLTDRGRETENGWSTLTGGDTERQEMIVKATSHLDKTFGRRLKGERLATLIDGRVSSGYVLIPTQPADTETVVVGTKTYRMSATLSQENDVLIGSDVAASRTNLANAISNGGDGTTAHTDTMKNYAASAIVDTTDTTKLIVAARMSGPNGDTILLSTTITGATASGANLTGGVHEGPQRLEFPRRGLYRQTIGSSVIGLSREVKGVPIEVMQATAEYAVRVASGTALIQDPTVDGTSVPVQSKREDIGPIKEETVYVEGAAPILIPAYPEADRLLRDFLMPAGRTFR